MAEMTAQLIDLDRTLGKIIVCFVEGVMFREYKFVDTMFNQENRFPCFQFIPWIASGYN